jgi:beta-1,2-mannobiose phosphorylase / 1,2-beta-oligomannan phosphorylase
MHSVATIDAMSARTRRHGAIIEANGRPQERGGVLNPAAARARDGELLLYPRVVEPGNISRVGIIRVREDGQRRSYDRYGFALEPEREYELRDGNDGYGCEDPRVTFVPAIDAFVMAYTAFGARGARIAIALSNDGLRWSRIGLMRFERAGLEDDDDKDAAFFPQPVLSPSGVPSLAFYHRPMRRAGVQRIRIGYVPLRSVLRDVRRLLDVRESRIVVEPEGPWGTMKVGAGTPPVLTDRGWLSIYHGVDAIGGSAGTGRRRYAAGILIHDVERPHIVRYRSPAPIFVPETEAELRGVVNDVVFPTGIDVRPGAPLDEFDVYYGMADERIGLVSLRLDVRRVAARSATARAA